MIFVRKPVALALLGAAVSVASFTAHAQRSALNPTVKVLARPQSPVPAECATDLSAVAPAMEPEPQPSPDQVMRSVPPSNDLRASMRRLQVTAEGDDYAAFKTALNEARRAAASHPPGGERNAANDALQVFADAGRVWDYAMTSPSGSFFDGTVQGGSLLGSLKNYPDYGKTIAGETLTIGDKTLYPTRESRRFLARESSRRLARIGVSTPARVAQGAQPDAWPHRPVATAPKKSTEVAAKTPVNTESTPKTTRVSATPKPHQTKQKQAEKTAKATPPKAKTPAVASTPVPRTKPAPPVKIAATTTTVAPQPPAVTATTAAPPPPPVPTTTTAAAAALPATTTATTTTAAPATDTTASAATTSSTDTSATASSDATTTTTNPPVEQQNGNMNLLLAIVLILVGIGVLVVLFRASD